MRKALKPALVGPVRDFGMGHDLWGGQCGHGLLGCNQHGCGLVPNVGDTDGRALGALGGFAVRLKAKAGPASTNSSRERHFGTALILELPPISPR